MSETPISLNRVRKARARATAKRRADENAVRHGRSGADKARDRTTAETERRRHEDHKREE